MNRYGANLAKGFFSRSARWTLGHPINTSNALGDGLPDPADLNDLSRQVRAEFSKGVEEAEQFNRLQIKKAMQKAGVGGQPNDVVPVTKRPKLNEKQLFLTGFAWEGREYGCDQLPFHDPAKVGKDRAAPIKKLVPAPMFAGVFIPTRNANNFARRTGLYPLDFDHVDEIDKAWERICAEPISA